MTTNLHYLIAGMAVLLVVLWQYSHQRQMDDRNSLMFRRLLTVVSLDVLAELVSTCFILYAPYSFGVGRMLSNTVFYLFQAILPLMLLYYVCTLCSSRVIHRNRAAHGHSDYRSGLYHFDQPLHRKAVLFRQHRLLPRSVVSAAVHQRPAAHRGGNNFCCGAPGCGQPPQSGGVAYGLFARRLRHCRAGRQSRGADDRLRPFAQHSRNVSDHQQSLRVHGQPDWTE